MTSSQRMVPAPAGAIRGTQVSELNPCLLRTYGQLCAFSRSSFQIQRRLAANPRMKLIRHEWGNVFVTKPTMRHYSQHLTLLTSMLTAVMHGHTRCSESKNL